MSKRIIFVMGVSGSGKSTIGKMLSQKLQVPFFDGDDYHPEKNVLKMQAGIPLTDEDRYTWLMRLHEVASENSKLKGGVIACSALKESYRKLLMEGIEDKAQWILLEGEFDLIKKRMLNRNAHFMPIKLLSSQFDTLEIPSYALRVNIDTTQEKIVDHIMKQLEY